MHLKGGETMAAATKICMGVGGYTVQTNTATEDNYTAIFFKGRKGDAVARHQDGKIILPARRARQVEVGSVWTGKLVDRGRYYLFYPQKALTPVRRQPGEFVVTEAGALIQTARGAVLLPRDQKWGDFKKIAQDVGRHRHSGAHPVSARFAKGIADVQDLEGFSFKVQEDPERCTHTWVKVDRFGGLDILACPACGAHRYREPVQGLPGNPGRRKRGRFTRKPQRRSGASRWLSTKGLHRRKVVRALKRRGVF
jgi:hypothetical protein